MTCLQNSKTASNAGYTTLQPHGKETMLSAPSRRRFDQWHFLAYGHWLSCDKGIDLLKINDEIRRESTHSDGQGGVQGTGTRAGGRIKRLQQQKDELKPRAPGCMQRFQDAHPLEDARPEPPRKDRQWFEDEIYIDYEWNPGSEVLRRASGRSLFSSFTMTQNAESPLQLALNGAPGRNREDGSSRRAPALKSKGFGRGTSGGEGDRFFRQQR